ncbi:hypothetical protein HNP84_005863 [Thermocatellispora tengchongensis]|uniref:Uncharacterized protein n=1 Tax=Thermocatellispora tengchongensis TaxID=1073253 RepID=A0A840PAT6_9ACTN|nr:hypothetical protein [Thermocatellispora tengchongensis]MBB5136119.1 hypothetical protein [Thermocatellispora tengchongensis]
MGSLGRSKYRRGRLAFVVSGLYLALVIGVRVFVEVSVRLPDNDGTVGVWLIFVTMPLSWVATLLSLEGLPFSQASLLTGIGLFQGGLLYYIVRGKKRPAGVAAGRD